jgi:hypothetical protein
VDEKTNRDVATFPRKPIQLVSCLLEFISVAGIRTARAPRLFVPKSVIGNHSRYRYLQKLSGDLNPALSPFKRVTPSLGACQKYLGQACRVAYAPPVTEACFLQSGEDWLVNVKLVQKQLNGALRGSSWHTLNPAPTII